MSPLFPLYAICLVIAASLVRKASSVGTRRRRALRKIVLFDPAVEPDRLSTIVEASGGRVRKRLPLIHGVACEFSEEEHARALLARSGEVRWVEDDLIVSIVGACFVRPRPKPPSQSMPWGVSRVNASECWHRARGNGVRVGVLDTGVEMTHPDLRSNVRGGFDTIAERNEVVDDNGHGTHVAGIIAASDNEFGVVGVAPGAEIYAVKAFDSRGQGQVSDIVQGVEWCVQQRMNVLNMSFGTRDASRALTLALEKAAEAGMVLVAAAGNDGGKDTVLYPARDPNVIAVTATTADDHIASFSSTGPEVDVCAPGADVLSTYRGSTYKTMSGTSMACPHVSGIAALILSAAPRLGPRQVRKAICDGASRLPGYSSDQQGAGLVNAGAALRVVGGVLHG